MTALKYVQAGTLYQAGAGNIIGATTIILTSFSDIYGNVLTMTNFGGKGYGTMEPDTNNEESFTFTGVVANANGTYTLTGISTVLATSPYTQTSGTVRQHSGGTKVVVSDTTAFWDTFTNKNNDETVVGKWTLPNTGNRPTLAADTDTAVAAELVTLGQLSRQAIAGAANASTSVKGLVELATQAELDARTTTGGSGALLVPTPDILRSTLLSDYKVDTGAANAYVITPVPAITAYVTGQQFSFKAINANTTASTIAVSGLTATAIKKNDGTTATALTAGDIMAGQIVIVEYDGTNFQLLSSIHPQQIQNNGFVYVASGTGNDTYVITVSPIPSAYAAGQKFIVKPDTANTGAATLNVNSLGAKSILRPDSSALANGDIAANQVFEVVYDGTNFILVSPVANSPKFAQGFDNSRNMGTASGNLVLAHGLGRAPRLVRITAYIATSSFTGGGPAVGYGVYDGTNTASLAGTSNILSFTEAGGSPNSQVATITVDATNITLAFTKSGSNGTSTINLVWEATA